MSKPEVSIMRLADGRQFTRRDMLGLLGAGAACGVVTGLGEQGGLAQARGCPTAKSGNISFPRGAITRRFLKDGPPDALRGGATMFPEPLIGGGGSPSTPPPPSACPMPCSPPVNATPIQ